MRERQSNRSRRDDHDKSTGESHGIASVGKRTRQASAGNEHNDTMIGSRKRSVRKDVHGYSSSDRDERVSVGKGKKMDEVELSSQKRYSKSKTRGSGKEGVMGRGFAATTSKIVLSSCSGSQDDCQESTSVTIPKKGNDVEDTDSEGANVKLEVLRYISEKHTYRNKSYRDMNEASGSKRTPSAHRRGFFSSLQDSSHETESESQDTDSDEVSIEEISGSEFMHQKALSKSETRPLTGKILTQDPRPNENVKANSAAGNDFVVTGKTASSAEEERYPLVTERAGSGNKEVRATSSMANARKNSVIIKDISFDESNTDSDKQQAELSSSFSESGNNDEEVEIEKIPESETRKRMTFNIKKPAPTPAKEVTRSSKRVPSAAKIDNKNKKKKGARSGQKTKNKRQQKGNIDDNVSSYNRSTHSTYGVSTDEIGPCSAGNNIVRQGIAGRTRSRWASTFKKTLAVEKSLSDSLESSSSGGSSFDDEDFKADDIFSEDGVTSDDDEDFKADDIFSEDGVTSDDDEDFKVDGRFSEDGVKSDDEDFKADSRFSEDGVKSQPGDADMWRAGNKREGHASKARQKKAVSNGSDESDSDDEDRYDIQMGVPDEDEPRKRKRTPSGPYDLCKMLADLVLGRASMPEKESEQKATEEPLSSSQAQTTLALKFRFEDKDPEQVEKTEYEKEMDELFAELEFCLSLQRLEGSNIREDDQEVANSLAEETTTHERCARGIHELVWIDDQGLICIYCRHVALGPKDVLPEWQEKTHGESKRKRFLNVDHVFEFEQLHLNSSADASAGPRNASSGTVWNLKRGVRETMYRHQQEGFEFLWENLAGSIHLNEMRNTSPSEIGGCIISHAPGTGKTRLTIVFIETYMKQFPDCRPLIITPASMILTWEEEFKKWNVEFPFVNVNNLDTVNQLTKDRLGILARVKRRNMKEVRMVNIYSWNMGGSVLGISYSMFEKLTGKKQMAGNDGGAKDVRKILLKKPGLVVLDEGHTPRNQRSNIWNVLFKLRTQKRIILSGTPFQNNFEELFNTLRIVRPAMADSLIQERQVAEMIASRRKNPQSSEVDDHAVQRLKVSMAPFVHVHKGTILQQSLPGLRDCVVVLKPPPLQKSLIERLEGIPSTFQFEHKAALLSVHPNLFLHSGSTEEERAGVDLAAVEASRLKPNEGVKTKFIVDFIRFSMAMKEKVLIFSQFIQPLELIKEQLKETFRWGEGKEILMMRGKLDQKHRQVLINLFNNEEHESKVMLASTRCSSEGISLVGASRVILLDVVWNPSVETQAISRAYRIGQKKFVYTYHLMTSGTTEADKYCRQAEKERLSELVFTSSTNERDGRKCEAGIEDRILEVMVDHENIKGMFEKIINQPKDTNLIQTFGLTS